MIAYMLRDETSSRANVRRSSPMVSRTSQSLRCSSITASLASTASMLPVVLSSSSPSSSSFVRSIRMASSSSRAMASGHHWSPAA